MIIVDFEEDDTDRDDEEQELDVSSTYLEKPPRWFLEGYEGPVRDFNRSPGRKSK